MDVNLCVALEELFKDNEVLDLGSGLGHYERCLLHTKKPMFPESRAVSAVKIMHQR
jgi:hypothetical protein